MAKYIRAADTIRARFNCLVIIIHHCGVEGSRPRGHTSLTGADDAQIAVYRDKAGNITVTVEFMKDGEASAPMGSKLEIVELGYDDDGDQMSSCIIVPTAVVDNKARTLPDGAKVALDQLQELIADIGEIPPASNHIPPNTKACSAAIWREHFYNTHPGKPDTKQKAFVRAATTLQKARLIGIWQDNVWLAGHAGHSRTSKDMSGERIEPDMAAAVPVAEEAGRTDRTPTLNGCPVSGSHVRRRLSEQMSVQSGGNADGTPKAAEEDTSQARGLKPVHSSPDVMPRRRRRNRMQQWLDHVEAGDDQEGELILAMRKDPDMREFETLDEMAKYLGSVKAKFYGDLVSFENLTATLPGIWQRYQEWERGRGTDNR